MKKLFFLFAVLASALWFTACNNAQSKREKEVADSLMNDSLMKDSVRGAFISPDLKLNELKGHVQSCETKSYEANKAADGTLEKGKQLKENSFLSFNENGNMEKVMTERYALTFAYDKDGNFKKGIVDTPSGHAFKLRRNKNGWLTDFQYTDKGRNLSWSPNEEFYDGECRVYISYSKEGYPVKIRITSWMYSFEYQLKQDEKGLQTEKSQNISVPDEYNSLDKLEKTSYIYKAFDSYGNWTLRECHTHWTETHTVSDSNLENTTEETKQGNDPAIIEERTIVYF